MNTRTFRHLTVLAALCCTLLFVAACDQPIEGDDQNAENITIEEKISFPETDQLLVKVTADMPTAVMSTFAESSSGAALVRRLPNTSSVVGENTRMALIKGSDVAQVNDEVIGQIVDVLLRNGFVAIETPTGRDILYFVARVIAFQSARQQAYIEENYEFGPDINPVSDVEADLKARYSARFNTIQSLATKAGIGSMDEVLSEFIIFSNSEYFCQEPEEGEIHLEYVSSDDEGNETGMELHHLTLTRTPYICGILADGAAEWLNGVEARRAKTKASLQRFATKAGSESLNKLMEASESFSVSGRLYFKYWDKDDGWHSNSVVNDFLSWGVHNMRTDKDYYYIQQNVLIKMGPSASGGKIYFDKAENIWSDASNYGDYNCWYGSFFSRYITSMDLSGNGTIHLEEAAPYTDNSTGYRTVNIGSEQSTSETIGITWGSSIGLSDASASVGGEYAVGTTNGTYFEVSSTHVDNDISVAKNTVGNKVSWTYKGNLPTYYEEVTDKIRYKHTIAPKALTNDINMDNQICWSVSKPSGQYTLKVTSDAYTSALLFVYKKQKGYTNAPHMYFETHSPDKNVFSHTLLDPFRATQVWWMYVTVDEMVNGGPVGDAASKIENRLRTKYPSTFRDEISLCDRTATSVQVITANINAAKEVFNENYDILQMFADEQGVKRYTIHWRCGNADIRLREGYTVESLF